MVTRVLEITPRVVLICIYYTVVANTIFAIIMADMNVSDDGLLTTMIFTQCIGSSATGFCLFVFYFLRPKRQFVQMLMVMMCMIIGAIFGSFLGSLIAAEKSPLIYFTEQQHLIIQNIYYTVMIGSLAVYLYIFHQRIFTTEAMAQEEKIKRLSIEKKAAETNLKLLQAQIEPHFLFNTLSNVLSLLNTDSEKGKVMMVDLIDYLRACLSKTRSDVTTLKQQITTIKAYLSIVKTRMGDRLQVMIDVPDALSDYPFPPMLIQPLVENAIRHGLEPKIEGGVVSIIAAQNDKTIVVEVADTGMGFNDESNWGVGVSNIKERIESIYGGGGQLIFKDNDPCGLKAIIEVPYERDHGNHR